MTVLDALPTPNLTVGSKGKGKGDVRSRYFTLILLITLALRYNFPISTIRTRSDIKIRRADNQSINRSYATAFMCD